MFFIALNQHRKSDREKNQEIGRYNSSNFSLNLISYPVPYFFLNNGRSRNVRDKKIIIIFSQT